MFFMYHAEHGARLFASVDEFEAAGEGWVDTPAKLQPAEAEPAAEPAPKKRAKKAD